MSYLVLARQYRPKNFAEMVGQDHVVQALSNALKTQRLHHAYLFTGTRGVGKTTISRILAKSLNCVGEDGQGGITDQPCGVCQVCRDIDSGRFIDYVELDAASNRGVDEISQLLEQSVYKPVVGRFKVFMIDEVHMLSNTAFNAMLKTLEEPPEYLKFVLATTDPQKVPVTVLSRCLQFNLRSMAPETISEHLQQVLSHEHVGFDPGSLKLIAKNARGSMRDALSLTDQAIAYGNGLLEEANVRQMLGSVDKTYVYQLIQAIATGNGKRIVELVDTLRMQGLSATAALDEMSSVLQRIAVLRVVPDALQMQDQDDEQAAALLPFIGADENQLLYSIVLHGQEELGLASDEYAALVMILLRALAFRPFGQNNDAVKLDLATSTVDNIEEKKTQLIPENTINTASPVALTAQEPVITNSLASSNAQSAPVSAPAHLDNTVPAQSLPQQETKPSTILQTNAKSSEQNLPRTQKPENAAVCGDPVSVANVPACAAPAQSEPEKSIDLQRMHHAEDTPPWDDGNIPEEAYDDAYMASIEQDMPRQAYPSSDEASTSLQSLQSQTKEKNVSEDIIQEPEWAVSVADITETMPLLPELSPLSGRWFEIAQVLLEQEKVAALARELVLNSEIQAIENDEHRWAFQCARQTLMAQGNQKKVITAIESVLGHGIEASFTFVTQVSDTLALRLQAQQQQRQKQAQAQATADPDVQKWLQHYPGARIVPNSTRAI